MPTRYIEINSTYRARKDDPQVGEFTVISGTAQEGSFNALFVPGFPVYVFRPNAFGVNSTFLDPYYDTTEPVVDPSVLDPYFTEYAGYILENSSTPYPGNVANRCLITKYNETGNSFSLEQALMTLPGDINPGDVARIYDPTPYKDTFFFVPAFPPTPTYFNLQGVDMFYRRPNLQSTFYVGYYLNNDSAPYGTVDARLITALDTRLYRVQIESPFTDIPTGPPPLVNKQLSIRARPPVVRGAQILSVSPDRKQVQLDAFASDVPNIYQGQYLYINPASTDSLYPNAEIGQNTFTAYAYEIIEYDGINGIATLDRAVPPGIGDGATPLVGRPYEILGGAQDYWSPMLYCGSTVSQSEPQCMEVELINLVLPNVPLTSGSRIAFYPYVYVDFRPRTSAKTVGKDIIYSNNPNAHDAIFICPITDIIDPEDSPFIKVDAFGMTQSIKFRPNDTFYFRVYLPDGTLFQPLEPDNEPPLAPNPALQIEAIFSYRYTPA